MLYEASDNTMLTILFNVISIVSAGLTLCDLPGIKSGMIVDNDHYVQYWLTMDDNTTESVVTNAHYEILRNNTGRRGQMVAYLNDTLNYTQESLELNDHQYAILCEAQANNELIVDYEHDSDVNAHYSDECACEEQLDKRRLTGPYERYVHIAAFANKGATNKTWLQSNLDCNRGYSIPGNVKKEIAICNDNDFEIDVFIWPHHSCRAESRAGGNPSPNRRIPVCAHSQSNEKKGVGSLWIQCSKGDDIPNTKEFDNSALIDEWPPLLTCFLTLIAAYAFRSATNCVGAEFGLTSLFEDVISYVRPLLL